MKMELIIFASLYQVKEGLIFYVYFFIEELSIYMARQSGIRSPYLKKASAARNSEVRGRSQEPLCSTRLNPTSCGCIRLTSRHDLPNTTDLSCPQGSPSCIQRLDWPQLPVTIVQLHSTTRPTSASRNDRSAAFNDSTDPRFPLRSSSCIQQLDRPQYSATIIQLHPTTRPTSYFRYVHPAAFYDSTDSYPHQTSGCISTTRPTPAIDITHLAEDPNTTATNFTHTFVNLTINRHFCCICYLAFVSFIVFGCHYLHALNLNHLQGRHAYRPRNKILCTFFFYFDLQISFWQINFREDFASIQLWKYLLRCGKWICVIPWTFIQSGWEIRADPYLIIFLFHVDCRWCPFWVVYFFNYSIFF